MNIEILKFGNRLVIYYLLLGDRCSTKEDLPGTCTKLNDCLSVQNDIQQGKRDHVICRFDIFSVTVCCPSDLSAVPAPTTTTQIPPTPPQNLISTSARSNFHHQKNCRISMIFHFNQNATSTRNLRTTIILPVLRYHRNRLTVCLQLRL